MTDKTPETPETPETSETPQTDVESARLRAARERVVAASVALDEARATFDERRRAGAARRRRAARIAMRAAVVLTAALLIAAGVLTVLGHRAGADRARADDVLAATRAAVRATLTADPADPAAYVASVRRVSSGEFRARIDSSAAAITAAVAEQPLPSTGQVVAAGIVAGRDNDSTGNQPIRDSGVDVLVVAEATNPQLVGGGAGDARVVLDVRMVRGSTGWTIDRVVLR